MLTRILFFILCLSNVHANNDLFLLMTVPKSGTHLVHNLVTALTGKTNEFVHKPHKLPKIIPGKYFNAHFKYDFNPNLLVKQYPGIKYFITVRDPRDVCVSSVFYYNKVLDFLLNKRASFDERLSFTIKYRKLENYFGVLVHFLKALDAIEKSNSLVIKFEDLVGPRGGGTIEKQILAIQQVGHVFNMNISKDEALSLGDAIYGNSSTFRSGQTGSWRNHFTAKHIEEFKKSQLQNVLVKLGYETDDQW